MAFKGDIIMILLPITTILLASMPFVRVLMRDIHEPIWLGLRRSTKDSRKLYWLNETNQVHYQYTNKDFWRNNPGHNCGAADGFSKTKRWSLFSCDSKHAFGCEMPALIQVPKRCPYEWKEVGDDCFQYYSKKRTWKGARTLCHAMDAELVTISDAGTSRFIKDNFEKRPLNYWTGLNDKDNDGVYRWADGNKALGSYTNWVSSDSDQKVKGQCVRLQKDKGLQWQLQDCDLTNSVLCQISVKDYVKVDSKCGFGWEGLRDSDDCYKLNSASLSWYDAQRYCRMHNGSLASINTPEEMLYLTGRIRFTKGGGYWSGGNASPSGSGWHWEDQSPFAFLNWDVNEPSGNQSYKCISISSSSGRWASHSCLNEIRSICKKPGLSTNPPPTQSPVTPSKDEAGDCPPSWQEYRGSCYLTVYPHRGATWNEASQECQTMYGNLVAISDEQENDFVFGMLSTGYEPAWIGLNDFRRRFSFSWSDSQTAMTFTNWGQNQPSLTGLDRVCVGMVQTSGEWADFDCNSVKHGLVCERSKHSVAHSKNVPFDGCWKGGEGYGSQCYKFYTDSYKTFDDAQKVCESLGGNLATLNDRYRQAYAASEVSRTHHWIGLSNRGNVYKWTNGEGLKYTNWDRLYTGEEKNICVTISSIKPYVGLWSTSSCSSKKPFICEYPRSGDSKPPRTSFPITTSTTPSSLLPCPDDWFAVGNMCYMVVLEANRWDEANRYCQYEGPAYGGSLVSLTSRKLEKTLRTKIKGLSNDDFWIGLNDMRTFKGYVWAGQEPFAHQNWGKGQPVKSGGMLSSLRCARWKITEKSGYWISSSCHTKHNFVCQAPRGAENRITRTPTGFSIKRSKDCSTDHSWFSYAGNCYKLSKGDKEYLGSVSIRKLNWHRARRDCQSEDADLVSITNPRENEYIVHLLKNQEETEAWIGLENFDQDIYKWTDGNPFSFSSWGMDQPDNRLGGEKCVVFRDDGYWSDEHCTTESFLYICKKRLGGPKVEVTTKAPTTGGCPQHFYGMEGTSKCYRVVGADEDDRETFSGAMKGCAAMTGKSTLVSIHSDIDQEFLTTLIADFKIPVWIGYNDRFGRSPRTLFSARHYYSWVDNSPNDYVNWDQSIRNSRQKCAEMVIKSRIAGEWDAVDCQDKLPYICEHDKSPSYRKNAWNSEGCPAGYYRFREACYKYVDVLQDWDASEKNCVKDGGHLASQQGRFDNAFIHLLLTKSGQTYVWIGLNYYSEERTFVWSDGWPVLYTAWTRGAPQFNLPCVSTAKGGKWVGSQCSVKRPSICKIHLSLQPFRTTPPPGKCPSKVWSHIGRYCYYADTQKMSWSEASSECIMLGGHLAAVHNEKEAKVLSIILDHHSLDAWIGLQRSSPQSSFIWSDDSEVEFLNWALHTPSYSRDPQRNQTNCVLAQGVDGKWSDQECTQKYGYVCQTKPDPITEPTYPTEPATPTTTTTTTTTALSTSNSGTTAKPRPTTVKMAVQTKGPTTKKAQGLDHTSAMSVASTVSTPKSTAVPITPNLAKQTSGKSKDSGMTQSAVAGLAVGVLCCIAVIVIIAGVLYKRRRDNTNSDNKAFVPGAGFNNATYDANHGDVQLTSRPTSTA